MRNKQNAEHKFLRPPSGARQNTIPCSMSISTSSAIGGVLVLIHRLFKEGAVNEEEKGSRRFAHHWLWAGLS